MAKMFITNINQEGQLMDNIQQRIYTLESMARQGEASSTNMKELFKLQTRVKAKERFLKISYEDA